MHFRRATALGECLLFKLSAERWALSKFPYTKDLQRGSHVIPSSSEMRQRKRRGESSETGFRKVPAAGAAPCSRCPPSERQGPGGAAERAPGHGRRGDPRGMWSRNRRLMHNSGLLPSSDPLSPWKEKEKEREK